MNDFDLAIMQFLNQFVGRSPLLDRCVELISADDLLKGGPIMALYWWLWFRFPEEEDAKPVRRILLATLMATMVALLLGRVVSHACPFRERPVRSPYFDFRVIAPDYRQVMEGW